jgi:hypothetical protein
LQRNEGEKEYAVYLKYIFFIVEKVQALPATGRGVT